MKKSWAFGFSNRALVKWRKRSKGAMYVLFRRRRNTSRSPTKLVRQAPRLRFSVTRCSRTVCRGDGAEIRSAALKSSITVITAEVCHRDSLVSAAILYAYVRLIFKTQPRQTRAFFISLEIIMSFNSGAVWSENISFLFSS